MFVVHLLRGAALVLAVGLAAAPAAAGDHLPVLAYGRFGAGEAGRGIRIEQFEAHLAEIAAGGWQVVDLQEAVTRLKNRQGLPERAIAITIDEAHESVFREAWPRLKRAGLPFTLFVGSNALDRAAPGHMTWAELREMAAAGVAIGSLTASQPHMADQSAARNEAELALAHRRISEETGRPPALFAYPHGEWSAEVRGMIAKAGYVAAFGQQSGVVHAGADWWSLPRFPMSESQGSLTRFRLAANALPLEVTDLVPADPAVSDARPRIGFKVEPSAGPIDRLACFASGEPAPLALELRGRYVEVMLPGALPPGRTRINCTLPAPEGRWRWLGLQLRQAQGG